MTIRILINGASGKMGRETVKAISEHPNDFIVVATTGRQDNLAETIAHTKPKVVVDFTHAEAVFDNAKTIIESNIHPVIGSSGLLKDQITLLQERCVTLKLGGIIAPNFSLGAVLMMKYAQELAHYFSTAEIIEMHHAGKLDSPSGTAIRTAELMAAGRKKTPDFPAQTKHTLPGARGAMHESIPIHAVRLPGLVANQEVIFGSPGETLSIKHTTIDRQCFMPGVLLACKKVVTLKHLVYGLEELL